MSSHNSPTRYDFKLGNPGDYIMNKNLFPGSSGVSEPANEWAQRNARVSSANGRTSGLLLTSGFLVVLDHSRHVSFLLLPSTQNEEDGGDQFPLRPQEITVEARGAGAHSRNHSTRQPPRPLSSRLHRRRRTAQARRHLQVRPMRITFCVAHSVAQCGTFCSTSCRCGNLFHSSYLHYSPPSPDSSFSLFSDSASSFRLFRCDYASL